MIDIKLLTLDDLDNKTLTMQNGKIVARANHLQEFLDPDGLDWKPYAKASVNGKTAMITRWDFKNTYKDPFITSMTVDNQGIADGVPSMYLTNLSPSGVDIVAVFKADGSGNEQRWEVSYKVEEADISTGVGVGITEQQFSTYLAQNLEIVEQISNFHDGWGNSIDSPFGIRIAGQQHMIDRVGRIKGTNWLVFGSSTMT